MSPSGKPFYFKPPWNILFELNRLRNLRPWDVNIAFLLTTFLAEMDKCGDVDFRASGVALDSSSAIYLMKSKLLLELEKPPEPPPKSLSDFLPPPLLLPVRYELPSTTVQELLTVLDEVLKGEHLLLHLKPQLEPILPPPPEVLPPVDLYLMEIEKQMATLLYTLSGLAIDGKYVLFSRLVLNLERLDAVKTFIVLLFVAQKGDVTLWQNEDMSEIYIVLAKGSAGAVVKPPFGVV